MTTAHLYELWEGERLYRAVFAAPVPPVMRERLARAVAAIRATRPSAEVARHRALLASGADLEALEYAARLLGRDQLLVIEIALVVRLAETLPENLPHFVAADRGRAQALGALVKATARAVVKLVKGLLLMLRGAGRA